MRERRADEAARDVVTFLKCEFMRGRVGEEFAAVVTGVTAFGLFVQLDGLQVDGLVHVATLGQDYYRFEEDRRALLGERSGQRFTLGDRLRVRLTRVDPSERKLDFELIDKSAEAFHPRRKPARAGARGAERAQPGAAAAAGPAAKNARPAGQRGRTGRRGPR
jgi:ribonuclease R